ncbi:hypothetical protein AVEN_261923-1 [Araneus ventricosus]|uniref:RNase H type-1 domain-containing protein n=1 Tax=Araneus ventricosus TaxID=182803 RepID=A0A4Y2DE36_ARAVE|nr:hypothetical protein AVEN_261923-1 [Araneus ventricosus]
MGQQLGPALFLQDILNSIERKFLLNISDAYSTSPTSALQFIEKILPLSLKAEREATYALVTRLKKSNSESALFSISYLRTKIQIAQDIQAILLNHPFNSLAWVKAHVGIQGNEATGNLAKSASTEGTPLQVPAPKSVLKKQLSLMRYLFKDGRTIGITAPQAEVYNKSCPMSRQHRNIGKVRRFSPQRVMVHFFPTSQDSTSDQMTSVAAEKRENHYTLRHLVL